MFFVVPSTPLDAPTARAIAESTNAMLADLEHAAAASALKGAAPVSGWRALLRSLTPRRAS
ncbi:hypothetical protein [Actinomyces sp. MRS3W]|uniref:hypothetical protein n=1 Tax=Actinomyces sp. MRS3W TaxID=2800796 RepID=UPI0028FD575D|nr:hypothetical protein [Actinomyces sp. MRS3W]MDU0347839.1 hypothetical protein [Actinomyces sp. MRS3W]